MPDADYSVDLSDTTSDLAGNFSASNPPGEAAATCPYAQEKAKSEEPRLQAKGSVSNMDDPGLGASYRFFDKEGAAAKFGDDKNNFQLDSYEASLSSGVSKVDGGIKADLISASASGAVVKAQGEKEFLDGLANVKGSAELLSAGASANAGVEISSAKKAFEAEIGGEANIAKVEGSGEFSWPIPYTGKELVVKVMGQAQVGAAASAAAGAGWSQEDGYFMEAKAKAAAGLGLGAGFSLGLRDKNG